MKSQLFTTVFDDPESDQSKTFARHLRELIHLSEEDRLACFNLLPKIRLTRTKKQTKELVDNLAKMCSASQHKIEHALSVANFLMDALLNENVHAKDSELWIDDVLELGWIESTERSVFAQSIEYLYQKLLPDLEYQDKESQARGGVLPVFKSIGMTVEVRSVSQDRYRWGTKVKDYKPAVLGTTMIASVHIGLDEGLVKQVYFQVDEIDLDNIIASFQATKKDMQALRRFLNLDSEENK